MILLIKTHFMLIFTVPAPCRKTYRMNTDIKVGAQLGFAWNMEVPFPSEIAD